MGCVLPEHYSEVSSRKIMSEMPITTANGNSLQHGRNERVQRAEDFHSEECQSPKGPNND